MRKRRSFNVQDYAAVGVKMARLCLSFLVNDIIQEHNCNHQAERPRNFERRLAISQLPLEVSHLIFQHVFEEPNAMLSRLTIQYVPVSKKYVIKLPMGASVLSVSRHFFERGLYVFARNATMQFQNCNPWVVSVSSQCWGLLANIMNACFKYARYVREKDPPFGVLASPLAGYNKTRFQSLQSVTFEMSENLRWINSTTRTLGMVEDVGSLIESQNKLLPGNENAVKNYLLRYGNKYLALNRLTRVATFKVNLEIHALLQVIEKDPLAFSVSDVIVDMLIDLKTNVIEQHSVRPLDVC